MTKQSIEDIYSKLKENEFVIYGTGFVAKQLYQILLMKELEKNLKNFVITKLQTDSDHIDGIPIKSISEIDKDRLVIIAVHEILVKEVENILAKRQCENYIWIYPYLHEMMIGTPIYKDVDIEVGKVIENCNDYRIAIRYLAIEDYYGINDCGFQIYRKNMEKICQRQETVERKIAGFRKLIENWGKYGEDLDSRIFITDKYELFDGTHRITLAHYHKQRTVKGNIFKSNEILYQYYGKNEFTTREVIHGGSFSDKEIQMIESCYNKLRTGIQVD